MRDGYMANFFKKKKKRKVKQKEVKCHFLDNNQEDGVKVCKSVGNPNFILGQTYVSSDESSRKCRKPKFYFWSDICIQQ